MTEDGWTDRLVRRGVPEADVAAAREAAAAMAAEIVALPSDPTVPMDAAGFQALLVQAASETPAPAPAATASTAEGIEDTAARLLAGETSSVELTEAALDRLEAAAAALNAVARLEPDAALAQARAADARLAAARAAGETPPALLGVPLAHKDLYAREGWVIEAGSRILAGRRAPSTAASIAALDRAGAVDAGRLNTVEFALGPDGRNAHTGPVLNPWDTARAPGGSSSGSGAAVASGAVAAALGSDTGGSIRLPAAACGIVGVKPTAGLIGRSGVFPLSGSLDTVGPLATSVRDAALVVQAMIGHDPLDPQSVRRPPTDLMARIEAGLGGLRVGVARAPFFDDLPGDIGGVLDAALALLTTEGAALSDAVLPGIETANMLTVALINAEAATQHRAWLAERPMDYGPETRSRLMSGLFLPAFACLAALDGRAPMLRAALRGPFREVDVIATPVLPFDPPPLEGDDVEVYRARVRTLGRCTRPFNYLGLPSVVLPCGLSEAGMPVALQLVGRPFEEATVLRAARGFERARAFAQDHRPAVTV
ncbi:MAG: amidase [Pseudomonadota bacterium]